MISPFLQVAPYIKLPIKYHIKKDKLHTSRPHASDQHLGSGQNHTFVWALSKGRYVSDGCLLEDISRGKGQEKALADEYEFITAAKDRCHVWLSA